MYWALVQMLGVSNKAKNLLLAGMSAWWINRNQTAQSPERDMRGEITRVQTWVADRIAELAEDPDKYPRKGDEEWLAQRRPLLSFLEATIDDHRALFTRACCFRPVPDNAKPCRKQITHNGTGVTVWSMEGADSCSHEPEELDALEIPGLAHHGFSDCIMWMADERKGTPPCDAVLRILKHRLTHVARCPWWSEAAAIFSCNQV